ncbi:MAG: Gfo/Idh/MocA family oxidoreductase [Candidatus Nealsonbacteria bacterium]|nr:Gfo/Idh/MocA family oxidoreductase [Candidatus Nealsonbacteria bacterium]
MNDYLPPAVSKKPSRRDFLKRSTSVATGATLGATLSVASHAHAAGSDEIKIALIGCGGRGTGAAVQALGNTAMPNVKLVAMADAFTDRVENCYKAVKARCGDKVDVPPERRFSDLDCHEGAINDKDVDMVLLCTPPGFRPAQFEAAVKAGKHVFMEKPVATDAPGIRRVMAANEEAKKKGLLVAVGHHLRHEVKHIEIVKRIHDGEIGKLKYLRAYFNTGAIWVRPRQADQTEMQYQVRNWYHFTWVCGDHIVEQHVHDLDACNWMQGGHPVEAQGMGGRQVCTSKDQGEIYDHHAVEYTYADGVKMFSYCRQIPGCWGSFSEHAHGTKGSAAIEGHGKSTLYVDGKDPVSWQRGPDGHQLEHNDLFAALKAGQPYNEGDYGASSTMTAILGRMATYSGKKVTWDDAINSQLDLMPESLAWDAEPRVKPGADGYYACAMPGMTKAY